MAEKHFNLDVGGQHTLIDEADRHLLGSLTWRLVVRKRKSYVVSGTTRAGKRLSFYLHRVILGAAQGQVCDHINGDSLDNRRQNLRFVTVQQNNWNARQKPSKHGNRFRGISTRSYGFASQIRVDGKIRYLGTFRSDVEAAFAYDVASIEHHGEFGRRNFLPLVY